MPASAHSPAWLRVGLTQTVRGQLSLRGGRLRFATPDGAVPLDVPVASVRRAWLPWYTFGGGLNVEVDGAVFRFALVRPVHEHGGLGDVAEGRAAGRVWRRVLVDSLA